MNLNEKEDVINKVCCNIMRRVTQSVNDSMPILPNSSGKFELNVVLDAALLENSKAMGPYKVTESDNQEVIEAIRRDLTTFLKMVNK